MRLHKSFRALSAVFAFALSASVLIAQQQPAPRPSPGFAWPRTLVEIQSADRMSTVSLEQFLDRLRPADVPSLQVGEFRFAPMEGSTACLVATVDASGRKLFYSLAVVCPEQEGGAFRMTILPSAPPHSLGAELMDLDGDGTFEVVTREVAGGYQGTQTLPLYWYSVFRVKASVPRDASSIYKAFYTERLLQYLELVSHLAERAGSSSDIATQALAEARFLRAKYDRRIAGNANAGLNDAIQWAKSNNPRLQMLAVETFRDMDNPNALAELKKLAKTKDYVVSQAATNALQAKNALPQ